MYLKLLLIIITLLFYSENYAESTKALWVVRDALSSDTKISKIISDAKELNCNKIFLQFRALGKVYYPSENNFAEEAVNPDLLKILFAEARKNNIEIHAWLNVCYVWNYKTRPEFGNHIVYKSEYSLIEPIDSLIKPEGYFLHPNDKANLSEIKLIITELIQKYHVDGIHLDYFRYPKDKTHTSKTGRTNYILQYGLDPLDGLKNPTKFVTERTYESYIFFQESYRNFLRAELTEALVQIRDHIKSIDKNVVLSVAVKPNFINAKHQFLQDWVYWISNNLCDFIVMMNYSPEIHTFINNLELLDRQVNLSKIIVGVATYNIEQDDILKRIQFVKQNSYKGYALFSYNNISENKELIPLLKTI